jgi:hypothetical protein
MEAGVVSGVKGCSNAFNFKWAGEHNRQLDWQSNISRAAPRRMPLHALPQSLLTIRQSCIFRSVDRAATSGKVGYRTGTFAFPRRGASGTHAGMKRLLALATLAAFHLHAAEGNGTFLDPATAGPDFVDQGEYVGETGGAQVIALGEGKFHIVGFEGGLPGTENSKKGPELDAKRDGDKIVFEQNGIKGELAGGQITFTHGDSGKMTLKKTERKSPTLGATPPAGALVLFDGKTADAWKDGKLDKDGNLQGGTKSVKDFGDCTLHVEFRTPFMPAARGQGRGNSGVYLQDRHEVQVLDSFGLKGENNECGGIYTKHKPKVNMCFPPLSWQTYDIDYTAARWDAAGKKTANARMTVKHNGVLVHDNVEVDGATVAAGRKEGPEAAPIQLQNHGNPVVYRNIWIVEKK